MNSSKRENLLNLALDATEEERLQSLNLNVGYQENGHMGSHCKIYRKSQKIRGDISGY